METLQRRLNPFLFAPDTNFRFILLIVSVLGASLFVYFNLYNRIHRNELASGLLQCLSEADAAYPLDKFGVTDPEYINQSFLNTQYSNVCTEPIEQRQARWILLGMGLLLLVTAVIYLCMPAIRIRRDRLTVFSAEDDPELMSYLLDLCRVAGLPQLPRFLLRALNSSPSGLAFGHLGRYYVVLNGGLITLFHQERERFRAIVLHELAHLRNQDVGKTYVSLALGISFVLVTLIPLFFANLAILISDLFGNFGFVAWQMLSVGIYLPVIYITLASILRSREVYADARVPMMDPHSNALRNELVPLASMQETFVARFLGLHPSPVWRLKVLDEPHLLFQLSGWDAFLAGMVSTFALRELDIFLSILLPPPAENHSLYIASLFFIPFVVAVVGLGVWQKVFASQVRGQPLSGFGRSGLSLGVGMLTGISLSFTAFTENSIALDWSPLVIVFLFNIFLGVLFLISLFLIFRWVALSASIWLETVTNPDNLRRVTAFGLFTTGIMMSFWVVGFYILYGFGAQVSFTLALAFTPALQRLSTLEGLGLNIIAESILASFTGLPLVLTLPILLFIVIWLFPLLSRLRTSRTSLQGIFVPDSGPFYMPTRFHPQLRPFAAFLAGLVIALGLLALAALARVWFHIGMGQEISKPPQWMFNFNIVQALLAILAQVALASIVALSVRSLGWAHGLLSAFVAGFLMSIGLALLPELGDCISIFRLGESLSCTNFREGNLLFWFGAITVLGGFCSLLPAFFASWIGSLIRRQTSKPAHE